MNREASQFDARSKAWTPSHKAASNKLAVFQTLSGSARLGRCDGLVFIMLFDFPVSSFRVYWAAIGWEGWDGAIVG